MNPPHQCYEMRAVFLCYRGEFQSESSARPDVPHNSLGPDLAFLDQKIKLGLLAQRSRNCRVDEQSPHAQIANARNIIHSITAPIDPHALRCRYPQWSSDPAEPNGQLGT